jgi:DNA-binding NarL/FixJ family response regulator
VRVLVADDSAGVRELLVLLLNMEQTFTVVGEARDGEAAVRMAKQLQPDLVILDVSMPRLDGIEALPKVRAVSPASRVVIFSGESDERVEAEARAAGAAAVIAKDVGATTLVERLHTLFIAPRCPGDELPAAG